MKAAVLEKVEILFVKNVPSQKPKDNEVSVKVNCYGVCGTDLKLYKGNYSAKCLMVLGHKLAGEVGEIEEKR